MQRYEKKSIYLIFGVVFSLFLFREEEEEEEEVKVEQQGMDDETCLQQSFGHFHNTVDCRDGVEVDVADAIGIKFPTLFRRPLNAQLPGVFVGTALHDFLGQRLRNVAMEDLGNDGKLGQFGHGFNAWDNGDGDAYLPCILHKSEILRVIEKQLGDSILGTKVLFLLEILHVALQVGCLLVLFRVAGHTEVELLTWRLDGRQRSPR